MSYQALARKWRPRRFSELVGQEHVVRALTHALDSGRLHHAFLFTGTRGVGKTTIARIFAKSLNCEKGPTSQPCGECGACTEIDAGRFVDLLEIDAASNTGIDNVRELIDNAQYAPTRGRHKVYLIDEVHMLSRSAFNALLKTLEEPPPHVKFLLATTDPQKLPVTVLSRCIKFNLKRLTPEQIGDQMRRILAAEAVENDDEAIEVLARAADGSLRDGLSLLDQAIAHGGGVLRSAEVHAMLGTVERAKVRVLLEMIAGGDAAGLFDEIERISAFAPDFAQVLDELAGLLHRVQMIQLVPSAVGEEDAALLALAGRVDAEDVQLWYQIAVSGRRDLPLAPTPRVGFEMTLLRMLAFAPAQPRGDAEPVRAMQSSHATSAPRSAAPAAAPPARAKPVQAGRGAEETTERAPTVVAVAPAGLTATDDWATLIERAQLRGPAGDIARQSTLVAIGDGGVRLAAKPAVRELATERILTSLETRLGEALGRKVRVRFESDAPPTGETPAEQRARAEQQRQVAAEEAMHDDPLVRSLIETFDAHIVPGTVRPLQP